MEYKMTTLVIDFKATRIIDAVRERNFERLGAMSVRGAIEDGKFIGYDYEAQRWIEVEIEARIAIAP
jgi:hypothetical protein